MSEHKKEVPAFFFFPRPQVFGDWTVPLTLSTNAQQPVASPSPQPPRERERAP